MRKKSDKTLDQKVPFPTSFCQLFVSKHHHFVPKHTFFVKFLSKKCVFCYNTIILRRNLKVEDTSSVTKIITALIHGNPEVEDARGELLVVFSAPNSDPTWIFFPLNHLEVVKNHEEKHPSREHASIWKFQGFVFYS